MRCPSCGAITQHLMECLECGAVHDNELLDLVPDNQIDIVEESAPASTVHPPRAARSLIEFPGVKSSIPQWRKELGERVREVQERRAREATLEPGQADLGVNEAESRIPLLELIPRTEPPPVNPIVIAALQRIERAHVQSGFAGQTAVATMLAYDEQAEYGFDVAPSTGRYDADIQEEAALPSTRSERVHNLAVVPRQVTSELATMASEPVDTPGADAIAVAPVEEASAPVESLEVATATVDTPLLHAEEADKAETPKPTRKPRRLIGDLNDPALNYLDSISVKIVDIPERRSAPLFFRFFSAILDLAVVCLLSAPVVALVKLTDLKWQDSRVLIFASGTFIVMGFLYLTISTAFTGRTLGMKPFSLRVVDARTGLIPTGGQSAARAFLFLLSLASAGIALIYTFVNHERRAAHDRFTRTAVVRV
jgi:uncharacterized RDD family membrane protein YckC